MDQEDTRPTNDSPTNLQQERERIQNQEFESSSLGMGCLAWTIVILTAWAVWHYCV